VPFDRPYPIYDFLLDIARYWSKIADCNLPHLYLVPTLEVTPLEFHQDLWYQKTRVPVLSVWFA